MPLENMKPCCIVSSQESKIAEKTNCICLQVFFFPIIKTEELGKECNGSREQSDNSCYPIVFLAGSEMSIKGSKTHLIFPALYLATKD